MKWNHTHKLKLNEWKNGEIQKLEIWRQCLYLHVLVNGEYPLRSWHIEGQGSVHWSARCLCDQSPVMVRLQVQGRLGITHSLQWEHTPHTSQSSPELVPLCDYIWWTFLLSQVSQIIPQTLSLFLSHSPISLSITHISMISPSLSSLWSSLWLSLSFYSPDLPFSSSLLSLYLSRSLFLSRQLQPTVAPQFHCPPLLLFSLLPPPHGSHGMRPLSSPPLWGLL